MDKKWFYVRFKIQFNDSYTIFGTDEEMATKLDNPDYRGRVMDDIGVWELTPRGKKKQRKDLVKAAFKRASQTV